MDARDGDTAEELELVRRAAAGDEEGWQELVDRHRLRLQQMVALRLDRRVQRRVNASDIVQEVYLEAAKHLADYLNDPQVPVYFWLRGITSNKLLEHHRHHMGFQMRDARRDIALDGGGSCMQSNAGAVADAFAAQNTSPSLAASKQEMRKVLEQALESLEPLDREVLVLRHFEHLSNTEVADVLQIDSSAASKRYLRALKRLKGVLTFSSGEDSKAD